MDSYDLIQQYRNKAFRKHIIITPNEAKDAIAADYAGNLLTDGSAVRQIMMSAPNSAQTFADIISSLKTDKESRTQDLGYESEDAAAENKSIIDKLSQAEGLWKSPFEQPPPFQNPTLSALKAGNKNGIIKKETNAGDKSGNGAGDTAGQEEKRQTYLIAPTQEQEKQQHAREKMWSAFQSQFVSETEMRKYLLNLSDKEIQKLPEPVRVQAKLFIDSQYQNMRDYLSYEGYGDIPGLAAFVSSFMDTYSFGLSSKVLERTDPNRAMQFELARKKYRAASVLGSIAALLTEGAPKAALGAAEKAAAPLCGLIGRGVEALLSKAAPEAVAKALGIGTAKVTQAGLTGYIYGALEGGVHSATDGNSFQNILKGANDQGLDYAGQNILAEGAGSALGLLLKTELFKALQGTERAKTGGVVEGAGNSLNKLPKTTADSVSAKLDTYLLEPTHPVGGSKAKWFKEALGFTKDNSADLAKQIVFNPEKAIQTAKKCIWNKV